MKVYLNRRYRFSAAHRLHSTALTDEQNKATYGKCNNPHGHGHNYEVELTVSGSIDDTTGSVVNLVALDDLARQQIILPFAYKNLNRELDCVPTTENFATELMRRVSGAWPPAWTAHLETIRIWETERNICEIGNE